MEDKIIKVKYQGKEYCKDCHADKYDSINKSPHRIISAKTAMVPLMTRSATVRKMTRSANTIPNNVPN